MCRKEDCREIPFRVNLSHSRNIAGNFAGTAASGHDPVYGMPEIVATKPHSCGAHAGALFWHICEGSIRSSWLRVAQHHCATGCLG